MTFFDGTWTNSYGSVMTIVSDGVFLMGEYVSSTGASGTYSVMGFGSTDVLTAGGNGGGASLALMWRPEGGTYNTSWHWVSGWGGQGMIDANGNPSITLNHAMVATCPYSALPSTPPGTYLDKVPFNPQPGGTPQQGASATAPKVKDHRARARKKGERLGDPIEGFWICAAQSMQLSISVMDATVGAVWGEIVIAGSSSPLFGYADLFAKADGIAREGLTVVALIGGQYLSFSGWLDVAAQTLTLLQMTSAGTPPGDTYVQTAAQQLTFVPG